MALANHRKAIRAELADGARRLRRMQVDALSETLQRAGIVDEIVRPDALVMVIASMGSQRHGVIGTANAVGWRTDQRDAERVRGADFSACSRYSSTSSSVFS
jgi:hypothetical protein